MQCSPGAQRMLLSMALWVDEEMIAPCNVWPVPLQVSYQDRSCTPEELTTHL